MHPFHKEKMVVSSKQQDPNSPPVLDAKLQTTIMHTKITQKSLETLKTLQISYRKTLL